MGPLFRGERIGMLVLAAAATLGTVTLLAFRAVHAASSAPVLILHPSQPILQPLAAHSTPPSAAHVTSAESATAAATGTSDLPLDPPSGSAGSPGIPAASTAHSAAATELVVHVAGAVKHPGVYHLRKGARCDDALKAAGGPTKEANTDAVNLAARIEDGTQIYIPTRKEHPGGAEIPPASDSSRSSPFPAGSPGGKHTARAHSLHGASGKGSRSRSGRPGKLTSPGEGTVELNTANAAELQRLPGVGPSLAQRILDYRAQNGPFHKTEDLLQVSGIGPRKFEKMQSLVHIK